MFRTLVLMFVTVAAVGGFSTNNFPIFYNAHTIIRKLQDSKEIYIRDVAVDSQNASSDVDKELNSLSDLENSNQYNTGNASGQESVRSQLETSSNNTNVHTSTNSKLEDTIRENQATVEVAIPTIHYDRTTSIFADDRITLLRIEYYVNNKLTYYSVIEQFDATTKSYIESIYQCDLETNIDPLIRTDVYVNGNLINSY